MFDVKEWTQEELDFLKNNYLKLSNQEISNKIDRTKSSVQGKLSKLGFKRPDKYYYDSSYFEKIDTEEKAYWLGFIYADGYVVYNEEQRNYELGIELKINDNLHLSKLNKSLKGNVNIGFRSRFDERTNNTYYTCFIRFYSKQLVTDLMSKGVIPNKHSTISIPKINQKFIIPFIRGYFDGDGCLRLNKERNVHSFDFATCSENMKNNLQKLLYEKYNINSYVFQEKNGVYRVNIKGMTNAYLFGKLIYENANIYLDRKYNLFYDIIEKYDIINRIHKKKVKSCTNVCLSK